MDNTLASSNHSVSSNRFFLAACIFSTLPVWLATYPPMVDLPLHANQISTFVRLLLNIEHFENLFTINLYTPYWGSYIIAIFFSLFLPVNIALKIVISLAIALTPWTAAKLRSLISNDTSLNWIFIPIGYSFAYHWGFINFMLGVPLTFIFIKLNIQYFKNYENTDIKQSIKISLCGFLLLITHPLLYIFSIIISFFIAMHILKDNYNLLQNKKSREYIIQEIKKFIPLFSMAPLLFLWFFSASISSNEILKSNYMWIANIYRLPFIISTITGLSYFYKIGFIYALTILLLLEGKIRNNWSIWPFLVSIFFVLLIPSHLSGVNFVAERFGIFIIPFYLFSFDFIKLFFKVNQKFLALLFSIISLSIIMHTAYIAREFNKDISGLKNIIAKMAPNKSLISFTTNPGTTKYEAPVFSDIAYWYQAEKGGLGDYSFTLFNAIVQYKKNTIVPSAEFRLTHNLPDQEKNITIFDYIIIQGKPSLLDKKLMSQIDKEFFLSYVEDEWHLYIKFTKPN